MPKHFNLNMFPDPDLRLFILSSAWNGPHWPKKALGQNVTWRNADDPTQRRFAYVLNAANGAVYGGGMGMPFWVMVDCGLMPGGYFGVMGPARLLPSKIRALIDENLAAMQPPSGAEGTHLQAPLTDDEIIPLAESCAVPGLLPKTVIAYSLYSLLPGLGVIAKAVMLSAYRKMGMKRQIGIGQFDNKSFRIHTRFGALEILNFSVPMHSLAHKTIYYCLTIPSEKDLIKIVKGESEISPLRKMAEQVPCDNSARHAEFEKRRVAGTHRYFLAAPGLTEDQKFNPIIEVKI